MTFERLRPMLVVALAAGLLAGCREEVATTGDSQFALTLEEVAHWAVAVPVDLIGGTILDSATILAWNRERHLWLFDEYRGEPRRLGLRGIPSINRGHHGVLLLASDSGSLSTLSADGTAEETGVSCPEAKAARLLVALEDGFAVVFPGGDQTELVGTFAVTPTSCEPSGEALRLTSTDRVTIAPAGHEGLIASVADPFRPLWRVKVGRDELAAAEIPASSAQGPGLLKSSAEAKWVGLPIVPLDRGFLRVSADVRSNRRRVDRWDSDGIHVKSTEVQGAFGFFASDPERRLLLGMRVQGEPQVVLYRWTWES